MPPEGCGDGAGAVDVAAAGKRPRSRRDVQAVGFLGVSDYGLGQLEVLLARYSVKFATAKRHSAAHARGLEGKLEELCRAHGVEYLGSVDANSAEVVERARKVDLVVIGGYDGILKAPVLEAPRHGVLNTHLGVLPLNRGCCPTMWAQLHGLPQGYTTYQVGAEIDFGGTLEVYRADPELGGLLDTNRRVYDALSEAAPARFEAALDAFEAGEPLGPCGGREAYHRKGMPNDAWLSFHWSGPFLRRFSLALDFAPYLPGRCEVASADGARCEVSISVEGECEVPAGAAATVGEVLVSSGDELRVRTSRGAVLCRLRKGPLPPAGSVLSSGRPLGEAAAGHCRHPIDELFAGDVLPLEPYLRAQRQEAPAWKHLAEGSPRQSSEGTC